MTRNELHVLARQAMRDTNTNGDDTLTPWMVRFVERFGQLVAEDEREACARVCDWWNVSHCAAAIRARGDAVRTDEKGE